MRNKSVGVGVANTSSIVKDVIKFIIVVIMMSERFEVVFYGDVINCVRDETGKEYNLHELIDILMNQQATINKQDDEIKKLKRTERSWRKIHCCNKESNNCGIVIEQQNIISKLESDLQKIPPKIRELWVGED